MRCLAIMVAMALPAAFRSHAQCHIDPVTGERVCAPSPEAPTGDRAPALDFRHGESSTRPSTLDPSAHCRIRVADGTTGSGTLVAADRSLGLVLTCSHLFDQSTDGIIVSFTDGKLFAARLLDRDRAHDLAALSIRRPAAVPLAVSDEPPNGRLAACGFGPHGQFRCVLGDITGQAVAAGAIHPSLTMAGAVRPGDSGGGVFNSRGEVVGVVWGQRDGMTYTSCGRPLREFLDRLRGQPFVPKDAPLSSPQSPTPGPQFDLHTWSSKFESQLRALDAKKQDKGDYLRAEALNDYLPIAAQKLGLDQFARRTELNGRLNTLTSRFESVRKHVEQVATGGGGFFQGLTFGKLVVGVLGLSGPLAVAVVIAGGLAGRRIRKHGARSTEHGVEESVHAPRSPLPALQPVAVDSPPPPQRTVPETHYVSVEKDSFAKAHQWASEHVARKYPGATEILQAQDSLIKQYLAAR
jgi:hypothetical protein